MKNIVITGGAGFIGINLVRCLLQQKKYKITVLDNLSTGNCPLLKQVVEANGGRLDTTFAPGITSVITNVRFHKGDIRDKAALDAVLPGRDGIVHLAAQTGVIPSIQQPRLDADINVMGTLNLLESALTHKVKKFIPASSAAPLGDQEPPLDESKVPRPLSPYGAGKLAAEAYCSAFHHSFGLDSTVLRFSNVYGPLSYHKGSVIALFIKRILARQHLTVYGDGEQTRDFLHVNDVCRIITEILEAPSQKTGGEVFQLGTGVETSVNRLVALLRELSPRPLDVRFKPERKGEIKRNYTSPQKLLDTLGVRAEITLENGLKDVWEWFETQDREY